MTTLQLVSPADIGTRDLVRAWLDSALPRALETTVVEVDCGKLRSATPSFLDELLKIIVVERHAVRVRLKDVSERAAQLAQRSATNRRILDAVEIVPATVSKGGLLERLLR